MPEIVRTWKYKDACRNWWEITMRKDGEQPCPPGVAEPDDTDFIWSYMLGMESAPIYYGTIVGQYDIVPTIDDVLLDFQNYINGVVIGFAMFSKAEEE